MTETAHLPSERNRGRIFRRRQELVTREIAGEVILVPVRGKLAQLRQIFVLSEVGAFIWRRIDGRRDLGSVRDGIVESFDVAAEEAEADLREYVGALEGAGLIVEASEPTR